MGSTTSAAVEQVGMFAGLTLSRICDGRGRDPTPGRDDFRVPARRPGHRPRFLTTSPTSLRSDAGRAFSATTEPLACACGLAGVFSGTCTLWVPIRFEFHPRSGIRRAA
jgi:hypothetical protein